MMMVWAINAGVGAVLTTQPPTVFQLGVREGVFLRIVLRVR